MPQTLSRNVGELIIRTWCWGQLYYKYDKEPQNSIGHYLGPYFEPQTLDGLTSSTSPAEVFSKRLVLDSICATMESTFF